MVRKLSESTIHQLRTLLSEKFGDPIGKMDGDGEGVPDERGEQEDMGNRGFGADLCSECRGMLDIDEITCTQCGKMSESENGGRHHGHASSCTCPDCRRSHDEENSFESLDEDDLEQTAPPGREKQVRALKKQRGVKNPFAVAWASYNKSHD